MVPVPPPLIVTLKLDRHSFDTLDRLRKQYFPQRRNFLNAHVTLFHALPGGERYRFERTLRDLCSQNPPLLLSLPKPRFLGRGVALEVDCPVLEHLRKRLVAEWGPWLRAQDKHAYQPHVTIQNKVKPEEARHLYDLISSSWKPLKAMGEGLLLWQYMGGPWELLNDFPFRKDQE